jgi:hypothetical protein
MRVRSLSLALACAASVAVLTANAQQPEPAPPRAASAPPTTKTVPRSMSPAEKGESAAPIGDLRPERPVTPQINVPLGKKPAALQKPTTRPAPTRSPAATGGIDDDAARCEAQAADPMRAKCRDKPRQEAIKR